MNTASGTGRRVDDLFRFKLGEVVVFKATLEGISDMGDTGNGSLPMKWVIINRTYVESGNGGGGIFYLISKEGGCGRCNERTVHEVELASASTFSAKETVERVNKAMARNRKKADRAEWPSPDDECDGDEDN
jgi:hypothetical protein